MLSVAYIWGVKYCIALTPVIWTEACKAHISTRRRKLDRSVKRSRYPLAACSCSIAMACCIWPYSACTQGSFWLPLACNLASVFRPSSSFPWSISHRGDSGKSRIKIARAAAGTSWIPRGIRHWLLSLKLLLVPKTTHAMNHQSRSEARAS